MTKIILDTPKPKETELSVELLNRYEEMIAERVRLTQYISDELRDLDYDVNEILPSEDFKERFGWSLRKTKMTLVWGIVEKFIREYKIKLIEEKINK